MDSDNRNPRIPRHAYRVNEAAEAGGVSRSTIYKLLKAGTLRSFKVLGRRLILVESFNTLFREGDR